MKKPLSIKLLNTAFKFISFFLPVKKRVLFLGSPRSETLMENGQLVYDKLTCNKKLIVKTLPHHIWDVIYISFYIMTSKVIVLDDCYRYFAYIPLKENQKLIQMWHGMGEVKKIGLDLPDKKPTDHFVHEQYDAFITSSPYSMNYAQSAFGCKPEEVKPLGYPRSDLLINNKKELLDEFNKEFPGLANKRVIIYLPTYRRYSDDVLLDYDYDIDWKKLDDYLIESNSILLVKRHPLQIFHNLEIVPSFCKNIIDAGDISYFPMMVGSDILITDYSSVFCEYLLLDKRVIFYCPDLDEYLDKHGLYLKYPDDLPGDFCETSEELLELLKIEKTNLNHEKFKERYISSCDGKSTEHIVNLIGEYLNE